MRSSIAKVVVSLLASGVLATLPRVAAAEEVSPAVVAPAAAPPAPAPLPPYARAPAYGPPQAPSPLLGDGNYRSPGLAVALSLQPLPIDFGNLYAENLGWGIAYTAIEVSLMAPMMWMTSAHMNHGGGADRNWSGMETGAMAGFVSGYVLIKLASGLHAGYAARRFNRAYEPTTTALVAPAPGGALLVWSGRL
jgi:hypothetical protein